MSLPSISNHGNRTRPEFSNSPTKYSTDAADSVSASPTKRNCSSSSNLTSTPTPSPNKTVTQTKTYIPPSPYQLKFGKAPPYSDHYLPHHMHHRPNQSIRDLGQYGTNGSISNADMMQQYTKDITKNFYTTKTVAVGRVNLHPESGSFTTNSTETENNSNDRNPEMKQHWRSVGQLFEHRKQQEAEAQEQLRKERRTNHPSPEAIYRREQRQKQRIEMEKIKNFQNNNSVVNQIQSVASSGPTVTYTSTNDDAYTRGPLQIATRFWPLGQNIVKVHGSLEGPEVTYEMAYQKDNCLKMEGFHPSLTSSQGQGKERIKRETIRWEGLNEYDRSLDATLDRSARSYISSNNMSNQNSASDDKQKSKSKSKKAGMPWEVRHCFYEQLEDPPYGRYYK